MKGITAPTSPVGAMTPPWRWIGCERMVASAAVHRTVKRSIEWHASAPRIPVLPPTYAITGGQLWEAGDVPPAREVCRNPERAASLAARVGCEAERGELERLISGELLTFVCFLVAGRVSVGIIAISPHHNYVECAAACLGRPKTLRGNAGERESRGRGVAREFKLTLEFRKLA